MNPYTLGIIASMLVYLAVGNYAGRRVKSIEDYYVAGRNGSTFLIVGTLVASYLSTAAFLGETGFTYEGYGGILLILITGLAVGVVAKFLMPGDDPGGSIVTTLLGIAGALVGGFLASFVGIGAELYARLERRFQLSSSTGS